RRAEARRRGANASPCVCGTPRQAKDGGAYAIIKKTCRGTPPDCITMPSVGRSEAYSESIQRESTPLLGVGHRSHAIGNDDILGRVLHFQFRLEIPSQLAFHVGDDQLLNGPIDFHLRALLDVDVLLRE